MTAVAVQPRDPTAAEVAREVELWQLLAIIETLEAQLAEARRVRQPVQGGPPQDWDGPVLALDDETFADLLGPKDRADRPSSPVGYVRAPLHPPAAPAHPWAGLKPSRPVALGTR